MGKVDCSKNEIKNCPFCGHKAKLHEECEMIWVICSNYDCMAQMVTRFDEPEYAIKAWNKRKIKREKQKNMK